MNRLTIFLVALTSVLGIVADDVCAQDDEIGAVHVQGSVHMITGGGGNIGVSAGADGLLMIDDKFEQLAG